MRLINASTLKLEEFIGSNVPPYAILSHRWSSEELTFKEVSKDRVDRSKGGYSKLKAACEIALSDHQLQWLWIDTCCIDKRSSAELTEAINSMYGWYEQAKVCIVFLQDVEQSIPGSKGRRPCKPISTNGTVEFEESVWFSRVWTLQELLAPNQICFYDRRWTMIGTKVTMESRINASTRIPNSALRKEIKWSGYPIAQKMFWASRRSATREEDLAYSLLGLFDVNMPLLYGEGKKAFIRLQEEIIKISPDRSFLLWGVDRQESNLLASSPVQFSDIPDTVGFQDYQSDTAFVLTNLGLEIRLELDRIWVFGQYEARIVLLAEVFSAFHYVLVLELEPNSNRLTKKGVFKREQRPRCSTKVGIRKCVIARMLPTAPRYTDMMQYFWLPEPQGVMLQDSWRWSTTNIRFQDHPEDKRRLTLMLIAYRQDQHWHNFSEGQQLCRLSPSGARNAVELSYILGNGTNIWFTVFFTLSLHPCVHIDIECWGKPRYRWDPSNIDARDIFKLERDGWKHSDGYMYVACEKQFSWRGAGVIFCSTRSSRLDVTFAVNPQGSIVPSLDPFEQPDGAERYTFSLLRDPPCEGRQAFVMSLLSAR